jgi:hypothetical protein
MLFNSKVLQQAIASFEIPGQEKKAEIQKTINR